MSTNRDLLKEAIADAKAVKETALANAKAALEEAFTPQIKSMLAAQILAEEEEEDEDDLAEADKVRMDKDEMEEGYGMEDTNEAEELEEEFDLEEILAELDLEEGDYETMEEETSEPHGNIGANTPKGEPLGFLDEEINLDEMDEDELKALIEDVIEDMIESGELEAGGDPVEFSDEEEEEGEEEIDMGDMEAEEEIEEGLKDTVKGFGQKLGTAVGKLAAPSSVKFLKVVKEKGLYDDLKKNLRGAPQNNTFQNIVKDDLGMDGLDRKQIANIISIAIELEFGQTVGGAMSTAGGPGEAGMTAANENKELQEALKAIKILKKELNEVNLLNSKLLYVNKIFRNKNLTESQKVKVLSAFDKATSVRETKIIYETLNEGLVSKTNAKSSIKESLGMASKPAGVAPKQPIVESDQMIQRFQKLAGIL
jgi:hypothetical protein